MPRIVYMAKVRPYISTGYGSRESGLEACFREG